MKRSLIFALVLVSLAARANAQSAPTLTPSFTVGQQITQIFSLTNGVTGDGFDPVVKRVAGSAAYTVVNVTPDRVDFTGPYEYDGLAKGSGPSSMDRRTLYPLNKGVATPDLESSGLTYNPYLWGAPRSVRVGDAWEVTIPSSWEMGTAGTQRVRVVAIDDADGSITLERTGEGAVDPAKTHAADSPWPLQPNQRALAVTIAGKTIATVLASSGPYRWRGFTTFRDGVVISDALLSERDVTLKTPDGSTLPAHQRMIMLLNEVPNAPQ
jgi:hypothetical protein